MGTIFVKVYVYVFECDTVACVTLEEIIIDDHTPSFKFGRVATNK